MSSLKEHRSCRCCPEAVKLSAPTKEECTKRALPHRLNKQRVVVAAASPTVDLEELVDSVGQLAPVEGDRPLEELEMVVLEQGVVGAGWWAADP